MKFESDFIITVASRFEIHLQKGQRAKRNVTRERDSRQWRRFNCKVNVDASVYIFIYVCVQNLAVPAQTTSGRHGIILHKMGRKGGGGRCIYLRSTTSDSMF